jgi:hypothetical protein
MTANVASKDELRPVIAARKQLGDEMEPAVIDAFVARIEARLADRADQSERAPKLRRDHQSEMVLGSMAISIPLLAIAAIFTGLPGVIATLRARRHRARLNPLARVSASRAARAGSPHHNPGPLEEEPARCDRPLCLF